MNCPVCQASGLPDEILKCPNCESDLEAFRMTHRIEKNSNNRLIFAIVAVLLFIAVLVIWLLSFRSDGKPDAELLLVENTNLKAELQKFQSENDRLMKENTTLQQQVDAKAAQPEKRVEEYIVRNGESLFVIARKLYGNGLRYVDIAKDNNLADPDVIRTGQKLIIYY